MKPAPFPWRRLAAVLGHSSVALARVFFRGALAMVRRRPRGLVVGEELARLAEALGPTYIKIGQILSARPDLLPPNLVAGLVRLQREVAPFDTGLVPALIANGLGRSFDDLFSHFDEVPVGSASIAQVHRATLHDSREVAVKVRRPGIVARVDADFRLLRAIARGLERLPPLAGLPFTALVAELEGPIRRQLDFSLEARANQRLRASLEFTERVRMPAVLPEYSSESVLVLEFVPDLVPITAAHLAPADGRTLAVAGLRALYRMIFIDGFVHADLHPGNVFVGPAGEVILLDTGLWAELDDDDLQDFVDFFFGLVNNRPDECGRVVHDTALFRAPDFDRARFDSAMVELIGRHSAKKSREFEVTAFAAQLLDLQRRAGLHGSTKFILTILAMVVYDGICKSLHPECDFQAEARGYLIRARYRHYPAAAV